MNGSAVQPLLAVVSTDIRRDLIAPMRHFHHLRIVHFYRRAPYGDLTPADQDGTLQAYRTPFDLVRGLWRWRPDIVQGVEPFAVSQLPVQLAISLYASLRRIPLVSGVHIGRPLPLKYGLGRPSSSGLSSSRRCATRVCSSI